MKSRLMRFLSGRYGSDELGKAITVLSIFLLFLYIFTVKSAIYYIAIVLLLSNILRLFSRNISQRQKENQIYLYATGAVKRKVSLLFTRFKERKTHKQFKCPSCGQKLRVPKNAGKIAVHCPKCQNVFQAKS